MQDIRHFLRPVSFKMYSLLFQQNSIHPNNSRTTKPPMQWIRQFSRFRNLLEIIAVGLIHPKFCLILNSPGTLFDNFQGRFFMTTWWPSHHSHLSVRPATHSLETTKRQTTKLMVGCRPAWHWADLISAGRFSNAQTRPGELEVKSCSHNLNGFMAVNLSAGTIIVWIASFIFFSKIISAQMIHLRLNMSINIFRNFWGLFNWTLGHYCTFDAFSCNDVYIVQLARPQLLLSRVNYCKNYVSKVGNRHFEWSLA